jgi:PTB domain (IRS-1 type)
MERFFYMEVGRGSVTGAGELWMVTVDNLVATHMHRAIYNAMAKGNKNPGATPPLTDSELESMGPKSRARSSSATEASKPIYMQQRRQTHGNGKYKCLDAFGQGVFSRLLFYWMDQKGDFHMSNAMFFTEVIFKLIWSYCIFALF